MASNELRNKTELTSVTGDEWVYIQESASPYAVKKVSITRVQESGIIGKSLMFLNSYIPISRRWGFRKYYQIISKWIF